MLGECVGAAYIPAMTKTHSHQPENPKPEDRIETADPPARKAPSWLNPLCEYGPLVVFFVTYLLGDLFQATAAVMVATFAALVISYAVARVWPKVPLITAPILLVLGGLTLYLQDETFIKIRPTIVNGLFCVALLISVYLKKSPLKFLMGQALEMSEEGWRILTLRFGFFFAFLAGMNELVWRTQSNDFWVTYKVVGGMALTFAFLLSQAPLINRHMKKEPEEGSVENPSDTVDPKD